MNVTGSTAYDVVGRCKTEASQKPVPVHPILAAALIRWRERCQYREPDGWVFANDTIANAIRIRDKRPRTLIYLQSLIEHQPGKIERMRRLAMDYLVG